MVDGPYLQVLRRELPAAAGPSSRRTRFPSATHIKAVAKELGGTIEVVKYVRMEKGEGIEKKADDFAAEVAAAAGLN